MIAFNHPDPDQEDVELSRRACSGSIPCLHRLFDKHRPVLFYTFLHWCGSDQLAADMVECFLFKITVRLRYRPAHTTVRLWLYRMAVRHLQETPPSPAEEFVRYYRRRQHISTGYSKFTTDTCGLRKYAPFDCATALPLALNRNYRVPFILDTLLGIKSLLGARIADLPPAVYRQRAAGAKQQVAAAARIRNARQFPLCPRCFKECNTAVYAERTAIDAQEITGLLLPTIADWQIPAASLTPDTGTFWLKRSFITASPHTPAVLRLIQEAGYKGPPHPGQ